MSSRPKSGAKWGIVSTIKAPLHDIADFAAHHLELGAHRLLVYLDDANDEAFHRLKQHPKIRVFMADEAHWRSQRRPVKHQVRQSRNAQHAYLRKAGDLDWLAHIDIDEFLWPRTPIAEQLRALPASCSCARVYPVEALSNEGVEDIAPGLTYFKSVARDRETRDSQTEDIYPTYGDRLNGGFLSHVAGKLFVRTGLEDPTFKIHNFFSSGQQNPGQCALEATELCHLHAPSRKDWLERFLYRHEKGSYRPDLGPTRARRNGGLTMHELFRSILDTQGEAGLHDFYEEVCLATPTLRARLEKHGLLRGYRLGLDSKRAKHFPDLA